MISILLIFLFAINRVNSNLCDNYVHPTYGRGKCVHQDRCVGNLYSSGLCENEIDIVKCCFSTPTASCATFVDPIHGRGNCLKLNECGLGYRALPGYCDGLTSDYRCCFNNTKPVYQSCGLSQTLGKGVCSQQVNCPIGQIGLSGCDSANGELCCYSLQNNVNVYEMRGVWVATVANIDWPSSRTLTTAQQQQELLNIIETVKEIGLNTIVFQIRPTGDAFYQSSLEPWSYFLTNEQGKAPNPLWDPLQFIVEQAHSRGIEVHAWFNPYRAKNTGNTYTLASNHMAVKYSQYAYNYNGYIWMDPAAEVVKSHTLEVIADVVRRYDVDAIHFDDYFYPYPAANGSDFPDTATYSSYLNSGGSMSKNFWRRDNVNRMIRDTYNTIKSIKPNVHFGLSPFGIWRPGNPAGVVGLDSYDAIFADSKYWLQQGWLDYLAPQLYWEIDPPAQSFNNLLKWWCEQNTKNKLIYAGTAIYKIAGSTNWPSNEIARQVQLTRDYRNIGSYGAIHYNYNNLKSNIKGIKDVLTDI